MTAVARAAAGLLAAVGLLAGCSAATVSPSAVHPTSPAASSAPVGTPSAISRQYGINVEPSYRPWRWAGGPNPDSWWDPSTGGARLAAEMPLAARLGVTYVRVEFPWTFLEPGKGRYNWTRADAIVAAARHYRIQLQPVIVYCPKWVGPPACVPPPRVFGSFVHALVTRYRAAVRAWEMWNEAADAKYFSGTERQYVQDVLDPGFRAAKAADPSARVVLSGQWDTSQAWIDGLFANGARFDIASYHDYSGSAASANATAVQIRSWLAAEGFHGPLWLGEFGLQEGSVRDVNQQAYFTGVIRSSNPASVVMWYNLRDDDVYDGFRVLDHHEQYGLMFHDLMPKLGFCAFHRLVSISPCRP